MGTKFNIKSLLFLSVIIASIAFPYKAMAVSIGTLSVGQKTGDIDLSFGIDFKMRRVASHDRDTADMTTKGFSAVLRYSIINQVSIFIDGGTADISLSGPDFKGYLGGSYGGGVRLSLLDPHRNRFTINLDLDVYRIQSGNGERSAVDSEYTGALYAAFKNANTITYGGLEASNIDLSFSNPDHSYYSKYNIGGIIGMDQFITPYVFFNFEVHIFDEQSIEGSIGYTFF